ncbi:hypothetical protein ASF10_11070 [Flavobacterium sp. Leaf82]|uniref:hypothetical protein n=1 Tax=unclassified Flavobacterium TaxID=196869 RepID=UPI0006F71936|nr:hypothetical protein [Flavobacterium sp. Leaf82]KQO22888.1 hypothetical protein ASF10_11070 [Flavobacterium sp. Leaf82]
MGSLIIVKGKKQEALYTTTLNKLALDDELCIYAIADFSVKNGIPYPNCEIKQKVDISIFNAINLDELAKY